MKIKRGLFRIWLVCSVIYATGIVAIGIPSVWNEFSGVEQISELAGILEFVNPPRPWESLATIIGVALGGPAVIFALGLAGLWAFSGFRETDHG